MNRISAISLIVANLIVALVVISQRWGYYSVILIYWFEAMIIGGYSLARMCVVCWFGEPFGQRVGVNNALSRLVLSAVLSGFFVAKFGAFALAMGLWVALTPGFLVSGDSADGFSKITEGLEVVGTGVLIAAAMLFISHGISFVLNFLGHREYQRSNVFAVLFKPYARMALVLVVLVAGFVAASFLPVLSRTTAFAVAIVLLKLVVDLLSHAFEHRTSPSSQTEHIASHEIPAPVA